MRRLVQEKKKAIELRRKGFCYQEILKEVKVAKSSLSLWLMDMPLTEDEKQILKKRKDNNISKGRIRAAASNHMRRVIRDGFLLKDSKREFEEKSKDPLFHIGIALYWAEGAKRSPYFGFTNSDPDMLVLMIDWVRKFLEIKEQEIALRLYTHRPFAHENHEAFWSEKTAIPLKHFKKTIYKPTALLVKKRPGYKGCIRIELYKVIHIRRMKYWQQMLIEYYRKQR